MLNGNFLKKVQLNPDEICIYAYVENKMQLVAKMAKFDGPHDEMATLLAASNELLKELIVSSEWIENVFASDNEDLKNRMAECFPKELSKQLGTEGRLSMRTLVSIFFEEAKEG